MQSNESWWRSYSSDLNRLSQWCISKCDFHDVWNDELNKNVLTDYGQSEVRQWLTETNQVCRDLIALFGDFLNDEEIQDIRVIIPWDELDSLRRALDSISSGVHTYGLFPIDVDELRSEINHGIEFSSPHVCDECNFPSNTRIIDRGTFSLRSIFTSTWPDTASQNEAQKAVDTYLDTRDQDIYDSSPTSWYNGTRVDVTDPRKLGALCWLFRNAQSRNITNMAEKFVQNNVIYDISEYDLDILCYHRSH